MNSILSKTVLLSQFTALLLLTSTTTGSLSAQVQAKPSAKTAEPRADAVGLYALWYANRENAEQYLQQPYMTGGQLVVQWKELEPTKATYDFSKIAQELSKFGAMGMYTTIQINGNQKPDWLYQEVPYHPEKFSTQIRDEKGSLMYWHPIHRNAYVNMLRAFSDFLKSNENRRFLLGLRQNFNGFGTEHLTVKESDVNLSKWIIPKKIDKMIEIKPWTKELKNEYEEYVLDNYIKLFSGVTKVFVRNTINESLELKYKKEFMAGNLCWFHTSSEAEPHSSEVERQYKIFHDYCRSGKTLAFAEPWASAWGHHGKTDDRWCSPPQWFYWTQLFNLHCGVSYIGLYSVDMQVAIDGTYKSGGVNYKDGDNRNYQKEFTDTILFAKKYVGFHDKPAVSPGAWVAFRENHTILAVNGISEKNRALQYFTEDYNFLMERLPDKSHGKGIQNVGPEAQRFGAWARALPAKEQMNFQLNPVFLESLKNNGILVTVTYYDAKNTAFNVILNNASYSVQCIGENKWVTKSIEVKDGILRINDKNAHIAIQNGPEDIFLHMIEVTRR